MQAVETVEIRPRVSGYIDKVAFSSGRVRRNVEAARGDLGASAATLRDARVSVIAEVARDYFILRGLQDQLALTLRNADNQERTAKLTHTRLEAGRGNELDTSRADRRDGAAPRDPSVDVDFVTWRRWRMASSSSAIMAPSILR